MNIDSFMQFIYFALFIYLAYLVIKILMRKFPKLLPADKLSSSTEGYTIKELLSFLVTNSETKKRLFVTIGILFFIRICYFIPLLGVDSAALSNFFGKISNISKSGLFLPNLTGIFNNFSIFNLSLVPFISSCLIIQFLSVLIPHLRKTTFGGEEGRGRILRYSYILTIIIALFQSYSLSLWLENPSHFHGSDILLNHGITFRLTTMLTMTAAVLLLLFLADIINKYGIGNGIAMIILSDILIRLFNAGLQFYSLFSEGKFLVASILLLALFVFLLFLIFRFTHNYKNVTLKDATEQKEFSIPLKISWVGQLPLSYALGIYLAIASLLSTVTNDTVQKFMQNKWINSIVVSILIILFVYLYALIIFKSKYIKALSAKYNFLFKSSEGMDSEKYLSQSLSKLLIITSFLLIILSIAPRIFRNLYHMPYLASSIVGSAIIAVLAGIFSDILNQLKFFAEKNKLSEINLKIAYIAFDEIEATIKAEYLKTKGINALIEPLRFTWGLPIRTAVDQYRIYTSSEKIVEARRLIEN